MKLKVGDKAPNFELPNQNNQSVSLKDARNKWLLLYFYPRDNTPGCTIEARSMRDSLPNFTRLNATVYGMSADSVSSHDKFVKKKNLNFTLLSDETKKTLKAYGAWGKKKFMGREYMGVSRMSYLIDPKGNIARIYEKVKPNKHVDEVLADLKRLQA